MTDTIVHGVLLVGFIQAVCHTVVRRVLVVRGNAVATSGRGVLGVGCREAVVGLVLRVAGEIKVGRYDLVGNRAVGHSGETERVGEALGEVFSHEDGTFRHAWRAADHQLADRAGNGVGLLAALTLAALGGLHNACERERSD